MKEHEDRYVAVVERYTLDGANTIILMKSKHAYLIIVKVACIDGAIITVVKNIVLR